MTRPTAGIDMYQHATTIGDNNLSDALDALPDRNDVISFQQDIAGNSGYFGSGLISNEAIGEIKEAIHLNTNLTDLLNIVLLVWNKTDSKYYLKVANVDSIGTPNIYTYDIDSVGFVADTALRHRFYSSCVFSTEAEKFAMFTCEGAKKLLWFDGSKFGSVDLPFDPKKIITHVNRVFAMDTSNKIWWCRAGDFYTWYGLEQDDDYIVTSTNCKNGSYTLIQNPDVPRPLLITLTAVNASDTYGTITIVGTDYNDIEISEVMNPVVGMNVSFKAYKTVTSITQAGWTINGGNDTIKIGIAAIGTGYVQQDQGYWTIEREDVLCDFCVLGKNLYIFTPSNIYVFSGYSEDTFALTKAIADIGMSDSGYVMNRHLTTANNVAYFLSNRELYEFNGSDMPRIITHSLKTNGSVSNYTYGGIPILSNIQMFAVACDLEYVYLTYRTLLSSDNRTYQFNIKSRSWWKRGTLSNAEAGAFGRIILLPTPSKGEIYTIASNIVDDVWDVFYGTKSVRITTNYPYITTKAFTANPSEEGTLTNIIATMQGTKDHVVNVSLYFANDDKGSTFTLVEAKAVTFTGNIERLVWNLHPSLVSRVLCYRLKLVVQLVGIVGAPRYTPTYLYNIERSHRIVGRSR